MKRVLKWIGKTIKEVNNVIWNTRLAEVSARRGFVVRYLRTLVLAARGFSRDKVQLRASSLTFYTMLSIIPMAAIVFAIAKGFGLEAELERQLMQAFANSGELMDTVLEIKDSTLQDTKGGYMAGIGVVILFWSVMQLLGHIESSFNSIWQVRQSRPVTRKMADYIAIMLVAPVFVITASSVTVFINTNLSASLENAPLLESMKWLIGTLVKFSPYLIMWFVLPFTFIVLPNTKVKFGSALLAGIVAGTLLQVVQWLYIDLQIGITRLSAIYGSFAAIPLFIIWIQTSWLIVLLGAEISFAHQNVMRYEFESDSHNISNYHKRILSLVIMNTIVKNFHEGKPPVSAEMIAADHRIPVRIASEIMYSLSETGLVSQIISDQDKQRTYQPGIDINQLTVGFVLDRLDKEGSMHTTVLETKEYKKIEELINSLNTPAGETAEKTLLKDI